MPDEIHLVCAISIPQVDCQDVERCVDLVDINFFVGRSILHDQSDTRRRSNGSSILGVCCQRKLILTMRLSSLSGGGMHTLSPKPHMRARTGCWTTCSDHIRPPWTVDTGFRCSVDRSGPAVVVVGYAGTGGAMRSIESGGGIGWDLSCSTAAYMVQTRTAPLAIKRNEGRIYEDRTEKRQREEQQFRRSDRSGSEMQTAEQKTL
jgi:hypothetical protein